MEEPLTAALLAGLAAMPGVRIIGPPEAVTGARVPVVSFTVDGRSSAGVSSALQV